MECKQGQFSVELPSEKFNDDSYSNFLLLKWKKTHETCQKSIANN